MKNVIYLISIFILFSCNNRNDIKFESNKWMSVEQGLYGENYRKKMVFDLIHNHLKFKQYLTNNKDAIMRVNDVKKIIGTPYMIDSTQCDIIYDKTNIEYIINPKEGFIYKYEVEEKFETNIDPNGGMTLELYFDKDSILNDWKLLEYWFQP